MKSMKRLTDTFCASARPEKFFQLVVTRFVFLHAVFMAFVGFCHIKFCVSFADNSRGTVRLPRCVRVHGGVHFPQHVDQLLKQFVCDDATTCLPHIKRLSRKSDFF